MGSDDTPAADAAPTPCPVATTVKAAKKVLKKQDSMKVKALAKHVSSTLGAEFVSVGTAKKYIKRSDEFTMEGKVVSLSKSKKGKNKKKRKGMSDEDEAESGSGSGGGGEKEQEGDKAKKMKKKRQRKEKKNENGAVTAKSETSTSTVAVSDVNVQKWRKDHKIVLMDARDQSDEEGKQATQAVNANAAYHPYATFDAPGCRAEIVPALLAQCTDVSGFSNPSPIQAQCWPVLLHAGDDGQRRDVVGIAETGSGKTLAFALPALTAMSRANNASNGNNKGGGKQPRSPRMLVLAPTRELAMQVQAVISEYGSVVSLTSLVVYGGVPKHVQSSELRRGAVDIIVATPGRLKDLINDGVADLSAVSHLVLDEADRMLDMGFEEDVKFILSQCAPKERRQTAMFSATWPAAIQEIALTYMTDPVRVYVGFEAIVGSNGENAVDDSLSANKRVSQTVEVLDDGMRERRLRELLNKYHGNNKKQDKILIFALYKKEAERLEYSLKRDGYKCTSIHGNKAQDARTRALNEFKSGKCPLLVATDVAARGLDIPNVEVVLNYTFPLTIEDYVHRIGRTGRAGKTGISHTFFQPGDKSHAGELQQVMRQAGQAVPEDLMKFGSTIKKKEHKLYGNFGPRGDGPMKKAVKITFDHSDDEEE